MNKKERLRGGGRERKDFGRRSHASFGALDPLFLETVRLIHRMRVVADQIHHKGEVSAGRRGVLKGLERGGPQTVPQMARARPVSRQHIQGIVNLLLEDHLVELLDNPAHKRSKLVALSAEGRKLLDQMTRREAELMDALKIEVPDEEIESACAVVREIRQAFQSKRWSDLVGKHGRARVRPGSSWPV